jgi:hypothetical protein
VLQVVQAGSGQCGLERDSPLVICSGGPHTWLAVSLRSRSIARNGWARNSASRNCLRSSTGSLFCARARPRAFSEWRCQRRHTVQEHPLFQRACARRL